MYQSFSPTIRVTPALGQTHKLSTERRGLALSCTERNTHTYTRTPYCALAFITLQEVSAARTLGPSYPIDIVHPPLFNDDLPREDIPFCLELQDSVAYCLLVHVPPFVWAACVTPNPTPPELKSRLVTSPSARLFIRRSIFFEILHSP